MEEINRLKEEAIQSREEGQTDPSSTETNTAVEAATAAAAKATELVEKAKGEYNKIVNRTGEDDSKLAKAQAAAKLEVAQAAALAAKAISLVANKKNRFT